MSDTTTRAAGRAETRTERLQRWIAAASSALLHVLFLFLLLYASKATLSQPQGAGSGSRVKVDFIGETGKANPTPPSPPSGTTQASERPRKPTKPVPVTSPIRSAVVEHADNPLPPDEKPQPRSEDAAGQPRPSPAPASAPEPDWRRSARWGQPPGMLQRETAPTNNGMTAGVARYDDAGQDIDGKPTMQVGGHQIVYDLLSENRLRAWRDQGMTELSFPLPGLREFMVCPLEIVLRRSSGGCRLVEPDDKGLAAIGDAREVVIVVRVYRRGELVWQGPGVYK